MLIIWGKGGKWRVGGKRHDRSRGVFCEEARDTRDWETDNISMRQILVKMAIKSRNWWNAVEIQDIHQYHIVRCGNMIFRHIVNRIPMVWNDSSLVCERELLHFNEIRCMHDRSIRFEPIASSSAIVIRNYFSFLLPEIVQSKQIESELMGVLN